MPATIKTRSSRVLHLPTADEDAAITAAAMADPDAVPITDEEWAQVKPLVRRGRPLGSGTKAQVTLRLELGAAPPPPPPPPVLGSSCTLQMRVIRAPLGV